MRRSRFSDSHPDRSACCSLSLMLETISGRRSPAPDQRPCLPCLKPPGRIRASRPCARSSLPAACAGTTSHCSFTGEDVAGLLDATGLAPLRTPLKRSHGGHRICGEALHSPRGVITFLSNALTAFSAGSPQRASESGSDGPAEDGAAHHAAHRRGSGSRPAACQRRRPQVNPAARASDFLSRDTADILSLLLPSALLGAPRPMRRRGPPARAPPSQSLRAQPLARPSERASQPRAGAILRRLTAMTGRPSRPRRGVFKEDAAAAALEKSDDAPI